MMWKSKWDIKEVACEDIGNDRIDDSDDEDTDNGDTHGDEEDNDGMDDDDNIDDDDEGSDYDVICDDMYSLLLRHMRQTSKPRMRCKYARRHLCFHIPSGSDCRRWTGLEQYIAGETSLKQCYRTYIPNTLLEVVIIKS